MKVVDLAEVYRGLVTVYIGTDYQWLGVKDRIYNTLTFETDLLRFLTSNSNETPRGLRHHDPYHQILGR